MTRKWAARDFNLGGYVEDIFITNFKLQVIISCYR